MNKLNNSSLNLTLKKFDVRLAHNTSNSLENCQYHKVDLSNSYLNKTMLSQLICWAREQKKVITLDLSLCQWHEKNYPLVIKLISCFSNLESLSLSGCQIHGPFFGKDDAVIKLCYFPDKNYFSLISKITTLKSLSHLDLSNCSLSDFSLSTLKDMFNKEQLVTLNLKGNSFGFLSLELISQMIRSRLFEKLKINFEQIHRFEYLISCSIRQNLRFQSLELYDDKSDKKLNIIDLYELLDKHYPHEKVSHLPFASCRLLKNIALRQHSQAQHFEEKCEKIFSNKDLSTSLLSLLPSIIFYHIAKMLSFNEKEKLFQSIEQLFPSILQEGVYPMQTKILFTPHTSPHNYENQKKDIVICSDTKKLPLRKKALKFVYKQYDKLRNISQSTNQIASIN